MYDIVTTTVLGSPMEVFLFRPSGQGPHPGIVLAHHLPQAHAGLEHDVFTLTTAQRFADKGYVVAVPFLFHWWPKSSPMEPKRDASRDDWMMADMQAALAVLQSQSGVDAAHIAVVGHCWGGRVSWLAASHIPAFVALATFYGGNVKNGLGPGSVPLITLAHDIKCPVIGFYGNNDSNPSPQDVEDYSAALSAAGVPHEFHQYDGAGHAFQNFTAPERYNAAASADAWEKVLAFLAAHTAVQQGKH